jgi:diguanylate cyclase (GGDEF)-like protein
MSEESEETKRYRWTYISALLIIGFLSLTSYVTVDRLIAQTAVFAVVTNYGDRQQLLTERVTNLALDYVHENNALARRGKHKQLKTAIEELETIYLTLTRGDEIQGIPALSSDGIDKVFFGDPHQLDMNMRLFITHTNDLLAKPWAPDIARNTYFVQLRTNASRHLLNALEDLEREFDQEAKDSILGLRLILLAILILTLSALLAIAIYVFRPLFARIAKQQLEMISLAQTDPMTNLFNRRYFMENADAEIARHQRYGRKLSVLALDIDHFKNVNDTYGHSVGDEAIIHTVRVCQENLRKNDIMGRTGGEEFTILLPETGIAEATLVAEKLRRSIAESKIKPTSKEVGTIRLTVSIGVANLKEEDVSFFDLHKRADTCLYAAKNQGRDRVIDDTGVTSLQEMKVNEVNKRH